MVLTQLRCRNTLKEVQTLLESISTVSELGVDADNTAIHLLQFDAEREDREGEEDRTRSRTSQDTVTMCTLTEKDMCGKYRGLVDELHTVMECDEWRGHNLYPVTYAASSHTYQVYVHNDYTFSKGKFIQQNVYFYHSAQDVNQQQQQQGDRFNNTGVASRGGSVINSPLSPSRSVLSPSTSLFEDSIIIPEHEIDTKLHVIIGRAGKDAFEKKAFDEIEMEFLYRNMATLVNHVSTTLEHSKRPFTSSMSTWSAPDPTPPAPKYRNTPNTSTGFIFPSSPVLLNPRTKMLYTVDLNPKK